MRYAVPAVHRLRRQAESRMGDTNGASTGDIYRSTGRMVQDETTGREVPEWIVMHADLPCRIGGANSGSSGTRTASTPGGDVQVALRTAHFPADTAGVADGDLIDVTAGELAGTAWRIVEADFADQQTALRLPVVAVARPEEWS